MIDEDYIRHELRMATAEYIKAVRLALERTEQAQDLARGTPRQGRRRYVEMNKVEQFHEDRRVSLEAFLHNMEELYAKGVIATVEEWVEKTWSPMIGVSLEALLGMEMSDSERERIVREFRSAKTGSERSAGVRAAETKTKRENNPRDPGDPTGGGSPPAA